MATLWRPDPPLLGLKHYKLTMHWHVRSLILPHMLGSLGSITHVSWVSLHILHRYMTVKSSSHHKRLFPSISLGQVLQLKNVLITLSILSMQTMMENYNATLQSTLPKRSVIPITFKSLIILFSLFLIGVCRFLQAVKVWRVAPLFGIHYWISTKT